MLTYTINPISDLSTFYKYNVVEAHRATQTVTTASQYILFLRMQDHCRLPKVLILSASSTIVKVVASALSLGCSILLHPVERLLHTM